MSNKKFKKFVVVNPEFYEKLKASGFEGLKLSEVEKKMVSVLRNNKLTINQRLMMYHNLLYQNMRLMKQQEPTINKTKVTTHEMSVQTTPQDTEDAEMMNEIATGQSTPYFDRKGPRRDLPSFKKRSRLTAFDGSVLDESILRRSAKLPKSTNTSQVNNDDDDEMDIDKEHEDFMEEVRRQSGGPVDFRDLTFRNLEDPDVEFATVENKVTGTVFPVAKSKRIIKELKKKQRNHQHIELGDPTNITPHKMRSGVERTMPAWLPFERLKF